MTTAWLGLGGNLGDVRQAMATALQFLDGQSTISVKCVSDIYRTPPWGVEDQPWFLNCCAGVETNLSPSALLSLCQEAERLGKRERIIRWGPRTIDVDILAFGDVISDDVDLTLPHPRMAERAFVLIPLAELEPKLQIGGKIVADLATGIEKDGIEAVNAPTNWWSET